MNVDPISEIRPVAAGTSNGSGLWLATSGDQNMLTVDALGFRAVSFAIGMQVGATGTANLFLESSPDGTNWTAVPIEDIRGRSSVAASTAGLVGTLTAITGKIAHVSTPVRERYYRLRQGNSSTPGGLGAIVALLSDPMRQPVTATSW